MGARRHPLRLPIAAAVCSAGLAMPAYANDSFGSEFSHVIAGAVVAGTATAVADHYGAGEDRGWIGFGVSAGLSFVAEAVQVIANGSSQVRGSSLDFASNLIGAAFGAWVTDRYILAPVVVRDAAGHPRVGVALTMDF